MKEDEILKLYYDPDFGLQGPSKFYKKLLDIGYKGTYDKVKKLIDEQEASQVYHKPIKTKSYTTIYSPAYGGTYLYKI